ncbi:hypothetical protein H5410_036949 [Solanum commersonii]|uniref:Uncharacterized protein n=1 Tax=Solanum commersonii TaxID=4109 RepID=A0A9J5Y6C8_SOLCO|nr:hypothetical protein H5410_036949 [Solanum commersonii]
MEESVKILMNTLTESEMIKSRAKDVEAMIMREVEKERFSDNHLMTLIEDLNYHVFRTLEE